MNPLKIQSEAILYPVKHQAMCQEGIHHQQIHFQEILPTQLDKLQGLQKKRLLLLGKLRCLVEMRKSQEWLQPQLEGR